MTSMVPGPDSVSSRSDQGRRLVVLSMDYEAESGSVIYRVEADTSVMTFVGKTFSNGAIRGIQLSELLEAFLQSYCAEDPGVVKRLVAATWRVVDGEFVMFPLNV